MIVPVPRLNKYMSSPQWTQDQQAAAADVLDGLESTLESALGTFITPRPMTETAAILYGGLVQGQQLVATRHPVASVSEIDGAPIADPAASPGFGQALPAPWMLVEHRVRRLAASPLPAGNSFDLSTWDTRSGIHGDTTARVSGYLTLTYAAGWGDVAALRKAIMDKAKAIMFNTHDDAVTARNMDAAKAPYLQSEDWTDTELAKLGVFRNLVAHR